MLRFAIAVVLALALAMTSAVYTQEGAEAATMILQSDFETDPVAQGWVPTPNKDVAPVWATGKGHSGEHYVEMSAGKWESPTFAVKPFNFYRVDFWYQASGSGHIAAFSYDAEGEFIASDVYEYIAPSGQWAQKTFLFRGCNQATTAKIILMSGYWPQGEKLLRVDDLQVQEVSDEEGLQVADEMWAGMPEMTWTPPAKRWENLPKTMAKLREGKTLKVVMLGDSIINDTSNGPWDLLLERLYPGSEVQLQVSVRGSTGCWYYQDPEQLKAYVLDHSPDLVWIGGISQKGDIDAIESVIDQTRAAQPEVEFILSGHTCGTTSDPRSNPEWSSVTDPHGDNWRSLLYQRAEKKQVQYVDLSSGWGWYVKHSDKPYNYFMRDLLHANDHGRMVLSRTIEAYFKPQG